MAQEATGEQRKRLYAKATARYPQLAEAGRRTTRPIPMIILKPRVGD